MYLALRAKTLSAAVRRKIMEKDIHNNDNRAKGGKWFFILLAVGLLCCVNGAPAFFFYPVGLTIFLADAVRGDEGILLALGYTVYFVLLVAFLVVKTKVSLSILIGVMVIVTCLNIAGCQSILHGIGSIGN